ncbi:hypothetical protein AVDCRST_MAG81-5026 [uncultured Synechococcales cyanobacterium]|uniref:Uncharacterized protein n=1 Tax=uncultured Synechococcales cyanobacterium TaxID=1936017 RepID=A0A6J4VW89_9CYAN|nr:hypothetical protein AVDCRST_MAG81-5026 [uncultured Synechococcales cyanobacterium]
MRHARQSRSCYLGLANEHSDVLWLRFLYENSILRLRPDRGHVHSSTRCENGNGQTYRKVRMLDKVDILIVQRCSVEHLTDKLVNQPLTITDESAVRLNQAQSSQCSELSPRFSYFPTGERKQALLTSRRDTCAHALTIYTITLRTFELHLTRANLLCEVVGSTG